MVIALRIMIQICPKPANMFTSKNISAGFINFFFLVSTGGVDFVVNLDCDVASFSVLLL